MSSAARLVDTGEVEPGLRVLVLGGAREGMSAARFLAGLGAYVTVSDRDAEKVEPGPDVLVVPEEQALAELASTDVCVVSPGIPDGNALLVEAQRRGIALTNATQIFLKRCPCPIVGVTGSNGKSTTTALIAHILRTAGRNVGLGGNIGNPMIDLLAALGLDSVAVVELSSFQLQLVEAGPQVAVVTNISPNHLDRHGDMAGYVEAKRNILRFQAANDVAVLNQDDPEVASIGARSTAQHLWFGMSDAGEPGAFLRDVRLVVRQGDREEAVCDAAELPIPGAHNVANALAAIAAASAMDAPPESMGVALRTFRGLPHRLEHVAEIGGVVYVDDSIATSPERAAVGLKAISGPVVLLAGGRSKHLPWAPLLRAADGKAHTVVLVGEAAGEIAAAVDDFSWAAKPVVVHAGSLATAVETARNVARAGDTVLLSPGGTSFDSFADYEERGDTFKSLVGE